MTVAKARVRGEVVLSPIDSVTPNGWNPNVVPVHKQRSIEKGFRKEGWLVSQSLLVWGKDEAGVDRRLIIDGEHRWKAAKAVGLKEGPMVFLDGITEIEARGLTLKLDQMRGSWDPSGVAELLRSVSGGSVASDLALDFGFEEEAVTRLLASQSTSFLDGAIASGGGEPAASSGGNQEQRSPDVFTLTVPLDAEQRRVIFETVGAEKKRFASNVTTAQALVSICKRAVKEAS